MTPRLSTGWMIIPLKSLLVACYASDVLACGELWLHFVAFVPCLHRIPYQLVVAYEFSHHRAHIATATRFLLGLSACQEHLHVALLIARRLHEQTAKLLPGLR